MDLIKELEDLAFKAAELYMAEGAKEDANIWALDITDNIVWYIEDQQKRYEKKRNKKYRWFNTICHFFGWDR